MICVKIKSKEGGNLVCDLRVFFFFFLFTFQEEKTNEVCLFNKYRTFFNGFKTVIQKLKSVQLNHIAKHYCTVASISRHWRGPFLSLNVPICWEDFIFTTQFPRKEFDTPYFLANVRLSKLHRSQF